MPRSPKLRIVDEGSSRKYWAQIPNLICDLGLPSQALALYVQIKRAAGEDGVCYKSTRTLAKSLKVGVASIVRAKTILETRRAELGNRALIKTVERKNPDGGRPYHEIRVADIWHINMLKFTSSIVELDGEQVPNIDLVEGEQVPKNAPQVPNTSSIMELKKNPLKKNTEEESSLLSELKSDPIYGHVDVEVEFKKAERWCALNHKKLTPRFFVNWLNRIERPFKPPAERNGHDAAWHARQAEIARRLGREYRPDAS